MVIALLVGLVLLQLTCMDMSSFYFQPSSADECSVAAAYARSQRPGNVDPILFTDRGYEGMTEADQARSMDCTQIFLRAGLNIRPDPCGEGLCAPYDIVIGRPRVVVGEPDAFELPVDYPCAGLCGEGGSVYFTRRDGHWRAGEFQRSWIG